MPPKEIKKNAKITTFRALVKVKPYGLLSKKNVVSAVACAAAVSQVIAS